MLLNECRSSSVNVALGFCAILTRAATSSRPRACAPRRVILSSCTVFDPFWARPARSLHGREISRATRHLYLRPFGRKDWNHAIAPADLALNPSPGRLHCLARCRAASRAASGCCFSESPTGACGTFSWASRQENAPREGFPLTRLVPCKQDGLRPGKGVMWGSIRSFDGTLGPAVSPRPLARRAADLGNEVVAVGRSYLTE